MVKLVIETTTELMTLELPDASMSDALHAAVTIADAANCRAASVWRDGTRIDGFFGPAG